MKTHRDQIQAKLGITWVNVTWVDLEKPLFSALAARLYLARISDPIPSDLSPQAEYWKTHYNTPAGDGTVQKFIDNVNEGEGCAKC